MNVIFPSPLSYDLLEWITVLNSSIWIFRSWSVSSEVSIFIQEDLNERIGSNITIEAKQNTSDNDIILKTNTNMSFEEYKVYVDGTHITIESSCDRGFFYWYNSLSQIFFHKNGILQVNNCNIHDKPRFHYRSFMLDVSRHFFSIDDIKKLIKVLSKLKINFLHLHLTDDQWWRLEIKKYPKLTSGFSENLGVSWKQFYTQDDIKDLIEYAKNYYIDIIPEIDIPGHCSCMLNAYPEFSCTHISHNIESKWLVPNASLCPTPSSLEFVKDIFDEVCQIFPSEYIHIWCDEYGNHDKWCTNCHDDKEKYEEFILSLSKYLESKGKKVIAWDEVISHKNIWDTTVMSWRSCQWSQRAYRRWNNSILADHNYLYFNYPEEHNFWFHRYTSLEKIYSFSEYISAIPQKEREYITGIQWCLWTEYVETYNDILQYIHPRIYALAELWWTSKYSSYEDFLHNISHLQKHI